MRVAFATLGCRLNQFETDALERVVRAAGHEVVDFDDRAADLYVVNSCTITHDADADTRQLVRRAARQVPGARVVVTGCMANADPDALAAMPEVARVLGNTTLYAAPGHGDALLRLRESGTLEWLAQQGVRHLMIANVDNLGATLDPIVLGAHLEAVESGCALSVEAVERRRGDTGGCVGLVEGRVQIVEGFRLPTGVDVADYPLFNTNTLWATLAALRQPHPLTWFPVHKTIDWTGGATMDVVQFETLIGQLSEFVPTCCLLVDRERFLPIKTREDLDHAAHPISAIVRNAGLHP